MAAEAAAAADTALLAIEVAWLLERRPVGIEYFRRKSVFGDDVPDRFCELYRLQDAIADGFIVVRDDISGLVATAVQRLTGRPTGREGDAAIHRYISVWHGQPDWYCQSEYTLYATRDLANAEIARRESHCVHSWEIICHEERQCRRCGCVEFVADM
jgi:hypothetical protein